MNSHVFIDFAIGILGYALGYDWKSDHPSEDKYDSLVYVGYPIIAAFLPSEVNPWYHLGRLSNKIFSHA